MTKTRAGNGGIMTSIEDIILTAKQRKIQILEIKNATGNIPNTIGELVDLTKLTFTNCKITTLPDTIGNLTNLKQLNMDHCDLTTLPDTIGNLKNLTVLGIYKCNLTTLPNSIGNLKKLFELSVHNNKLTTIPKSVCKLSSLEFFQLQDNPITRLPSCIFDKLAHVEILIDGKIDRFNTANPLSKLMTKKTKINDLVKGYDAMNISRQTIYTFLEEDEQNIVFITNGNAELTNINTIRSVYKDAIIYECYKAGTMRPENINKKNPLFNLRKIGLTVANYTYLNQIKYILNNPSEDRIYNLEIDNTVESVVSQSVLDGGTYVSAQHCQAGQGADVYNIIEVVNTRTNPSKARTMSRSKTSKPKKIKTRKISSK